MNIFYSDISTTDDGKLSPIMRGGASYFTDERYPYPYVAANNAWSGLLFYLKNDRISLQIGESYTIAVDIENIGTGEGSIVLWNVRVVDGVRKDLLPHTTLARVPAGEKVRGVGTFTITQEIYDAWNSGEWLEISLQRQGSNTGSVLLLSRPSLDLGITDGEYTDPIILRNSGGGGSMNRYTPGRNLVIDSRPRSLASHTNTGAEIATVDGETCIHFSGAMNTTKYLICHLATGISKTRHIPQAGDVYTFSADVKMENVMLGSTNPYIDLYGPGANIEGVYRGPEYDRHFVSQIKAGWGSISPDEYNGAGWVRLSSTITYGDYNWPEVNGFELYARDFTGDVWFKNLKVEYGDEATDWRPAPEDAQMFEGGVELYDPCP